MSSYIILLLLTTACVIVVDLTDFIDSIKHMIWKWAWKGKKEYRDFEFKPFSCSLCLSWWTGLIYLLISWKITLTLVVYQLLLSFLTPVIKDALLTIKALIQKIIDTIWWYFNIE